MNGRRRDNAEGRGRDGEDYHHGQLILGEPVLPNTQVAANVNYRSVRWMLGFAQCVSSQYGIMRTVQ